MKLNKVIIAYNSSSTKLEERINEKLEKVVFAEQGELVDIKFISRGSNNYDFAALIIYSVDVEVTMEIDTKYRKVIKSS